MAKLWCLLIGMLCGVGLGISEMTRPAKVLGLLNLLGDWDPSLFVVMGFALLTFVPLYHFFRRWEKPICDDQWRIPTRTDIDWRLVVGSAIFGLGWGIAGLCPGPAITDLTIASTDLFLFVGSLFVGAFFKRYV